MWRGNQTSQVRKWVNLKVFQLAKQLRNFLCHLMSLLCSTFGCFLWQRFQIKWKHRENLHPDIQSKNFLCSYPRDPELGSCRNPTVVCLVCLLLRIPVLAIKFSCSYEAFPSSPLSLLFLKWPVLASVFYPGIWQLTP